jgi:hypothetical protein
MFPLFVGTGRNADKRHQQKPRDISAIQVQRSNVMHEEFSQLITRMRDCVLAPSITLGPGPGEKVDAAG